MRYNCVRNIIDIQMPTSPQLHTAFNISVSHYKDIDMASNYCIYG